LFASIYVVGEAVLIYVSAGLPWFGFHSGNSLINNIYSIQPASYFGIHGMSFIVVFVNYLIADLVVRKRWIKLLIPISVVLAYTLFGFLIYKNF